MATRIEKGDQISISIPTGECADTTGTPIVVNDYLIYSINDEESSKCQGSSPYADKLFALDLNTNELYAAADLKRSESTPVYVPEENLIFVTVLQNGAYYMLDSNTFEIIAQGRSIQASSDSSASYLNGKFFFGTINHPNPICQNPLRADCGALFSINTLGEQIKKLTYKEGFRAWVTGAPTTNGEFIFTGGGTQVKGQDDEEFLYGCNIIKMDENLNILANADPDQKGCKEVGMLESAIVGEVSLSNESLWVQVLGPGDEREKLSVIQYDYDLNEICRAEFQGTKMWGGANFYQAPTIDKDGNAYVTYQVPANRSRKAKLYKIDPECNTKVIAETDSQNLQSPTLADDQYVLFANDNTLYIYTMNGDVFKKYQLASEAGVKSAPVINDGVIYVLQMDGTLNIIKNSGLNGYGEAFWPRFRHDNNGSGSLMM